MNTAKLKLIIISAVLIIMIAFSTIYAYIDSRRNGEFIAEKCYIADNSEDAKNNIDDINAVDYDEDDNTENSEGDINSDDESVNIAENDIIAKSEEFEQNVKQNIRTDDWKNIYANLIMSIEDVYRANYSSIHYISVNDLNFDGTPELVMFGDAVSASHAVSVYRIIDGKAECMVANSSPCDMHDHNYEDAILDKTSLYMSDPSEQLSLRKNVETGELKYVICSRNGGSDDSFCNIVSFGKSESVVEFDIVNEFEYVEYWDFPMEDRYLVSGEAVSKDIYEQKVKEYYDIWQLADYEIYTMANPEFGFGSTVPLNLEMDSLLSFFEMYKAEE